MKTYRVRVLIESVDGGAAEHSEVHLGNMKAEKIGDLVAKASTLGDSFAESPRDEAHPRDFDAPEED